MGNEDEPSRNDGEDEPTENGSTAVRRERFAGGPAREFMSSLASDRRIFEADLAVDRAHVVMLAEQGILEDATAGAVLTALDAIETAGHDSLPEGEDVHEAIETAVIDRVGPEGGRMHTARSRNDEVATCIRYRLREDLLSTLAELAAVRGSLLSTAEAHTETLLPGYTHLQPAQPITVAHWLASYENALARDTERLLDAYDRVNRSPLGAAAFAGTTFDIDRTRTADLLGFVDPETGDPAVVENSIDAAAGRDVLLEVTGALSALAVTCSGLAEDGVVFANRGLVDLDDAYASTSSIMPQKKNPDSLELVRAVAGDAAGSFQGVATTLKGLPRAYNRDLQRVGPHVWSAIDDVTEAVAVAGGAVTTADWDEAALAAAAGEGFSTATGVADCLAKAGVPFRTAHEVVALAAESIADSTVATSEPGLDTAAAIDELDAAAEAVLGESILSVLDRDQLAAALSPAASVGSRDSLGGPAPEAVTASLRRAQNRLEADSQAVSARTDRLETAADTLTTEVAQYD